MFFTRDLLKIFYTRPRTSSRRLFPATLLLAIFSLVYGCGDFQMEGTLGEAKTEWRYFRVPYWIAEQYPEALAVRDDLPPLRAATYNLHSGLGPDWRLFASREEVKDNLRAIARGMASAAPAEAPLDVIGLNEVDFHSRRSGWIDQARFLAEELYRLGGERYRVVGSETWRRDFPGLEVRFGNALLVRHPVVETLSTPLGDIDSDLPVPLPAGGLLSRFLGEQRGAIRVSIDFHGQPVDLLVTHLEAFVLQQREAQAAEILQRLVRPGVTTVLMGDINAVPTAMTAHRDHFAADRTHDILTSDRLVDARIALAARSGAPDLSAWATFPSENPEWPLDAVFATSNLMPAAARMIGGTESDHRGLLIRYTFLEDQGAADQFRWHDSLRRHQLERLLAEDISPSGPARKPRTAWLLAATGFGDLMNELTEPKTMLR